MKKAILVLISSLCVCSPLVASESIPERGFREIGQLDIDAYYFNLPRLLNENNYKVLAIMGENAREACHLKGLKTLEFEITDQLVSSYFKLGEFDKSLEYAFYLRKLSDDIGDKAKVANSFYKLSAALRGYADSSTNSQEKFEMFNASRTFIYKSLEIVDEYCPDDAYLYAKIFFNAGALEAQDLNSDIDLAIHYYEKAIAIFAELGNEGYLQRTLIRLAKAHILKHNLGMAKMVIETLENRDMPPITLIHFYTLQGTLLIEEKNGKEALIALERAKKYAETLSAKQDILRIELLIEKASSINFQPG